MKLDYHDELMLLSATHRAVTFEVPPDADHAFLRALRDGRNKGRRYAAAFVTIGDDEEPAPEPAGASRSGFGRGTGRTIAEGRKTHQQAAGAGSAVAAAGILGKSPAFRMMVGGDDGARAVRLFCGVESRSTLDDSPMLAMRVWCLVDAFGHWLSVMEAIVEGKGISQD